jgi:ATP-dependent Clp protease, protease subunit
MTISRTEELEQEKLEAEIACIKAETIVHTIEADKTKREIELFERNMKNVDALAAESKVYTFYDPVKEGTVYRAIEEISTWARRDPQQPITVVFTSSGGSVLDGLAFYDFLKSIQDRGTPVNTVALGFAASMAAVLLQSGVERSIGKNTWLLIHEVSDVVGGNMSMIEDQVEFGKRLQGKLLDILSERSTLSKKQIQTKWKKKDWWLDSTEALELGFVDRII